VLLHQISAWLAMKVVRNPSYRAHFVGELQHSLCRCDTFDELRVVAVMFYFEAKSSDFVQKRVNRLYRRAVKIPIEVIA
jgi:hypothetical protein